MEAKHAAEDEVAAARESSKGRPMTNGAATVVLGALGRSTTVHCSPLPGAGRASGVPLPAFAVFDDASEIPPFTVSALCA